MMVVGQEVVNCDVREDVVRSKVTQSKEAVAGSSMVRV